MGIQQLRGPNFTQFWTPTAVDWTFYIIPTLCSRDSTWNFYWPTYPPDLVHVVIECPPVVNISNFSLCGSIWRSTQIQIEFLRALHQTDWTTAEHCIKHSLAFSKHRSEPLFLKLQLFLAQGTIHILRKHFFCLISLLRLGMMT